MTVVGRRHVEQQDRDVVGWCSAVECGPDEVVHGVRVLRIHAADSVHELLDAEVQRLVGNFDDADGNSTQWDQRP